jgi:hypothetical protein
MNERELIEQKAEQVKKEVLDLISRLSPEEIFEMICAPEATDDWEDIDFDEDIDEAAERDFIESWIREESAYATQNERALREVEAQHVAS